MTLCQLAPFLLSPSFVTFCEKGSAAFTIWVKVCILPVKKHTGQIMHKHTNAGDMSNNKGCLLLNKHHQRQNSALFNLWMHIVHVHESGYVHMHMYLWVCARMYTYACMRSRWQGVGGLGWLLGNGGGQASLWIKAKVRAAAVAHVQGEWRPQMALH